MSTSTDRIEKKILLRAPQARVWEAISDAQQFGSWFGIDFDAPFRAGQRVTGHIAPTRVDPEVAKLQRPHAGKAAAFVIDRIEPMSFFSFRWHPYAVSPGVDYSAEPMTLVVFELAATPEGTQLTITESGFDRVPLDRRAATFAANEGGWSHQVKLIQKYLANEVS